MNGLAHTAARFLRAFLKAYARKWSFLGIFLFIFVVLTILLGSLELLPEPRADLLQKDESRMASANESITLPVSEDVTLVAAPVSTASQVNQVVSGEKPDTILIPSISLRATIKNPSSVSIAVLDQALLTGAVRYPTSALPGEPGNVILFGHSSYLPVVRNQAYKTFDGIQNLKKGDQITISSGAKDYVYAVEKVEHVSADAAAIPLQVSGAKLTLATCDSFGKKSDRFLVTASLVESHASR